MKMSQQEKERRRSIMLFHAVNQGRVPKKMAIAEIMKTIETNKYPENEETHKEAIFRITKIDEKQVKEKNNPFNRKKK